jgi:hypothetical protein
MGNGNIKKTLPSICPVYDGRLIHVLGDALEPGQEAGHVKRIPRPNIDKSNRVQGSSGSRKPLYMALNNVQSLKYVVYHPKRRQYQTPEYGYNGSGKNPGDNVKNPEYGTEESVNLGIQEHGKTKSDKKMKNNTHHRKVNSMAKGLMKNPVFKRIRIMFESDKGRGGIGNHIVEETVSDNDIHGINHQHNQYEHDRKNKKIRNHNVLNPVG